LFNLIKKKKMNFEKMVRTNIINNNTTTTINHTSDKIISAEALKDIILNSSPGMSTFIWGPLFWNFFNDIAVAYDVCWTSWNKEQQKSYNQFWYIVSLILPCKWCRNSYSHFIQNEPPSFPFTQWLFELHEKVNKKLHKISFDLHQFQRRCLTLTSFSNHQTLWDLTFILALNYDPIEKFSSYQQWFRILKNLILPLLVQYRAYEQTSIQAFLEQDIDIQSKYQLFCWLSRHCYEHKSLEFYLYKYSFAIANNTGEDIYLLCGPFLKKCQEHYI
jgi:hypothetical protein